MGELRGQAATERPSANGSKRAEFLIEQCQKLADIYSQRCEDADSQATTVLTAGVTLAALVVTASATLKGTSTGLAIAVLAALVITGAVAVWVRSGAGLRPMDTGKPSPEAPQDSSKAREGSSASSWLSHETVEFWKASERLRVAAKAQGADEAHLAALALWSARASDLHYIARWKERFAAAAGIMLAIAVILIAILAAIVVARHPGPSTSSQHAAITTTRAESGRPLRLLVVLDQVPARRARHGS